MHPLQRKTRAPKRPGKFGRGWLFSGQGSHPCQDFRRVPYSPEPLYLPDALFCELASVSPPKRSFIN